MTDQDRNYILNQVIKNGDEEIIYKISIKKGINPIQVIKVIQFIAMESTRTLIDINDEIEKLPKIQKKLKIVKEIQRINYIIEKTKI